MWYRRYSIILFFLPLVFIIVGCGSRFSSLLSESLSENYVLAEHGAVVSHPEINDGDMRTWGTTVPGKRDYTITFPEERQIDRIVIYSGNVLSYQLVCWDSEAKAWKVIGGIDSVKGGRRAYSKYNQLDIPQNVHRVDCKTNKITLRVLKARSDGSTLTRTPKKDDKILNHRVDYMDSERGRRVRIDVYEIYKQGNATIREIEAYSHVEKTEEKTN